MELQLIPSCPNYSCLPFSPPDSCILIGSVSCLAHNEGNVEPPHEGCVRVDHQVIYLKAATEVENKSQELVSVYGRKERMGEGGGVN